MNERKINYVIQMTSEKQTDHNLKIENAMEMMPVHCTAK